MWIISWRWNGKAYIERYETYEEASERSFRLKQVGHEPSIHLKETVH